MGSALIKRRWKGDIWTFDLYKTLRSKYFIRRLDGSRCDELDLTITLNSKQDVDDLIEFLKISRYCFPDNQK